MDCLPPFTATNDAPMPRFGGLGVRAEAAGEVAAAGLLDLDDLGAHEGELVGAERARQHVRQVEDAHAVRAGSCAGSRPVACMRGDEGGRVRRRGLRVMLRDGLQQGLARAG